LIIDNIEFKGHVYYESPAATEAQGFAVFCFEAKGTVYLTNCYAHDWVVETNHDDKFGGFGAYQSNVRADNCVVTAPPTVDMNM